METFFNLFISLFAGSSAITANVLRLGAGFQTENSVNDRVEIYKKCQTKKTENYHLKPHQAKAKFPHKSNFLSISEVVLSPPFLKSFSDWSIRWFNSSMVNGFSSLLFSACAVFSNSSKRKGISSSLIFKNF